MRFASSASESEKADIALVFYAGHGAQVNGENYLLPVDIDIPRTESDIQLSGLKVDDLVNSIRARTKVVFLDACRDNPALFKNLVKGRGAYPTGLAPALGSNLSSANPNGGVFIAYATEAGSVAQEGEGKHSPFTQALLKNLTKPISIDDMFSLVTREVRLVTKNTQRPYKYASLENIVCLTGNCSTAPNSADTDVVQQAKRSEAEELQIALQTNGTDALETYLQKYPESVRRNEVLSQIAKLKRAEYIEWTMYEVSNNRFPQYIKFSSIDMVGDKVAVLLRNLLDPSITLATGNKLPEGAYSEDLVVFDCKKPLFALSERTIYSPDRNVLYHYKWADPQLLDLSIGAAIPPRSVAANTQNLLCHEELRTPLLARRDVTTRRFISLSSTVKGDGEIFYSPVESSVYLASEKDVREIMLLFKMHDDTKITFPPEVSIAGVPEYRTEVDRALLKCDENKFSFVKSDCYNASNSLAHLIQPVWNLS